MTDWHSVVRAICPHARADIAQGVADALPAICDDYGLTTTLRQAHFLAQCAHESAGFRTTVEYASGRAYEGRVDLGNTKSGDGVKFKGRGLIQLTGRANYSKYGAALGVDLVSAPETAAEFPIAIETAALYWKMHGLNRFADADDVNTITKRINGGYNGLADRKNYLMLAKRALARQASPAVGFLSADDAGSDQKVLAAQERLKALGYFPGRTDRIFGPTMRGVLVTFQGDNGLPPTGELDEETVAALGSAMTQHRPLPASRSEATIDDLRDKGSATIKAADEAESGLTIKTAAGIASVGTLTETVSQASSAKDAIGQLPDLVQFALSHALLIAVIVAGVVIWIERKAIKRAIDRIRDARLDDHRSGANMGR